MGTFRRVSLVVLCALTAELLEVSPAITHTQQQQVQSASANQAQLHLAQATQTEQKIDPSLIPGLQAQLKAAQDEAASASDTRDAAKKEMDQRMSEKNRWQDEYAAVKKDQELYQKQFGEQVKEAGEQRARVEAYIPKCVPKYPRELAAFCQSEYTYLNSWKSNLDAQKARLDQSKANIAARFSDIQKMIDGLTQRISSLTTDYMNANFKYIRATQRVEELTKVLEQQNR
jgi:DNA repair exonuclease SbcCD ATPase subunit